MLNVKLPSEVVQLHFRSFVILRRSLIK
ncbi:unnamed protein product [Acanthoscelides obtectus]|uniref:Uncharacterized protein n=1 Tax=Acanthoscelides obtectus TaxID=200917 RepID=A0A9P0K9A6_ACAOB|nr:unnamed protein product [Acanthoscelides obtectus]CAK1628104.1 hypothetical protein AOBTE_LOCUS5032 [Acanthoscelides obtectus]